MSVSTHLQLLTTCEQWGQGKAPTSTLLGDLLPLFREVVPAAHQLRLYRLEGHALKAEATSDAAEPEPLSASTIHSKALTLRQPFFDSVRGAYVVPLNAGNTPYGIIEVVAADAAPLDAPANQWLLLFGAQAAQALDHRALRVSAQTPEPVEPAVSVEAADLAGRVRQALTALSAASSLEAMAGGLSRSLLASKTVIVLALNGHDPARDWHVIHTQPASVTAPDGLTWDALPEVLRAALESGESRQFLRNTETVETAGEALARWLERQGLASAALVPLLAGGALTGLLLVADRSAPCLTAAEAAALEPLAGYIAVRAQALTAQAQADHARRLLENLNAAAQALGTADDGAGLAQAVARTLGRDLLAVGVTRFSTFADDGRTPAARRLIGLASADARKPVDSHVERPINVPPDVIDRLKRGLPVILNNIRGGDSYLSPQTQVDYGQIGTRWLVSFGVRAGDVLIGTLDLLSTAPRELSPDEIAAFAAVADQIGLLLASRQPAAHDGDERTAHLLAVSRRIAARPDAVHTSAALLDLLPAPVEGLLLLLADQAEPGNPDALILRAAALATRDGVVTPDAADHLNGAQIARLLAAEARPEVRADVSALAADGLTQAAALLESRGLSAAVSVPLSGTGLILAAGHDPAALARVDFDALQALGGHAAALLRQRDQLDQTRDALAFVAAQYETSTALFQSDSLRSMLAVIFRFAGGRYAKALLALVDDPARIARVVAQIDSGGADDPEMETQTLFTINVPERPASGETILRDPAGRSLTLLLHRRDGHLAGLVQLINGEPVTLSPGDERALRGLADQLAIILENRLLLEETDKVLSETRALYEMNKALVATRSSLDVLGAIHQTVGQRAHALALAELGYSDQQQLNAFDVYALVTPDRAAEVSAALYDDARANAFLQLMAHWDVLGDQVDVVPDAAAAEQRHPALDYFEANGIRARALVVIPVFDGGVLRQQLIMTYDAPQHFTERDRRLFTALKDQVRVVLENQRLLRASSVGSVELESQVKLLQAVVEFVAQIAVARTENEMLSSGAEAIVRAAGVDHVGISIINPDGNSATVTGEYPDLGAVGSQIPADNPLTQHILREQAPRFINDIDDEPLLADEPRQAMIAMGIKSLVLYPLIDGRGQALGIIGMDSYRSGREFTPQMYDVVRTIAAQMVISLQNIRQLRETQRQAQQLQKLNELNQTIQPMMNTPVILKGALDGIGEIFPADRVAVYAAGADRGQPLLVLERVGAEIVTHTPPEPLALDAPTAAGRAWTSRVLVNVPDAPVQGVFHSRGASSGSVLAAPLFARGVVVGLIEIGHAQTYGFSDSDALIFRQLVNQISAAIENAEAYTAIQRSARAKTLVNDISSQLQKQSEIVDVLNVTMTELGRALGARKARIRLGDVTSAGAGTPAASDAPATHNPQETEGN